MTMWPSGMTIRPLTHAGPTQPYARKSSDFSASWSATLDLLDKELGMLRAQRIVLELDFQESDLRIDGMPRANARMATPAVAISFESKHGPLRYATDVFTDWQANVRAIALGLEALRKVDRYGISKRGEQYKGWRAIENTAEDPLDVLARHAGEVGGRGGRSDVDAPKLWRAALDRVHPDRPGGSRDAFNEVQQAKRSLVGSGRWPE